MQLTMYPPLESESGDVKTFYPKSNLISKNVLAKKSLNNDSDRIQAQKAQKHTEESVKEGNVGIKKIAEKSGYAFRGRYHDPDLNYFYYEDVYYKNCMVAADGSPIKYGKGWQCLLFHLLHQIDVG